MAEKSHTSRLSPIGQHVRQWDVERFILALFLPASGRESAFAILALNSELARIPSVVSEPMIGLIRFAWWRELLDEIYAGSPVRRHEIAQPLADAIARCELPRVRMETLIELHQGVLEQAETMRPEEAHAFQHVLSETLISLQLACCPDLSPRGQERFRRLNAIALRHWRRHRPGQAKARLIVKLLFGAGFYAA